MKVKLEVLKVERMDTGIARSMAISAGKSPEGVEGVVVRLSSKAKGIGDLVYACPILGDSVVRDRYGERWVEAAVEQAKNNTAKEIRALMKEFKKTKV